MSIDGRPGQRLPAEEVARRAREIYDREIRERVEGEHRGEFLVLDVTTGRYYMDPDELTALDRAIADHPEGERFLMRIGYRAAHRIGFWRPES